MNKIVFSVAAISSKIIYISALLVTVKQEVKVFNFLILKFQNSKDYYLHKIDLHCIIMFNIEIFHEHCFNYV